MVKNGDHIFCFSEVEFLIFICSYFIINVIVYRRGRYGQDGQKVEWVFSEGSGAMS